MLPPIMTFMVNPGVAGYKRVGGVIVTGLILIGLVIATVAFFSPLVASVIVGIIVSAVASAIVLIATPRAAQIAVMGMALGISADAGYAQFTNKTPVTIANALVQLSHALLDGLGVIAKDTKVDVAAILPPGVWAFIVATIVFMALSFLIKHDG